MHGIHIAGTCVYLLLVVYKIKYSNGDYVSLIPSKGSLEVLILIWLTREREWLECYTESKCEKSADL